MRKKKVLVVTKTLHKGGAASGVNKLLNLLHQSDVEVVSADTYGKRKIIRYLERLVEKILFGTGVHCFKFGKADLCISELVSVHKPDVIFLGDISGNVIDFNELQQCQAVIVHRLSDKWYYNGPFHYEEPKSKFLKWIAIKAFVKSYDKCDFKPSVIICPSNWILKEIEKLKPEGSSITWLPNTISELPNLTPVKLGKRIKFGLIAQDLREVRKGLHRLSLFLKLWDSKDIELVLYGKYDKKCEKLVERYGVVHKFMGPFVSQEIQKVYSSIDVFLCPSIEDNSPNTIIEAQSYGIPVICQKGIGGAEYVVQKFGCVIDFDNPNNTEINQFCTSNNFVQREKIRNQLLQNIGEKQFIPKIKKILNCEV